MLRSDAPFIEAFILINHFLQDHRIRYCLIGGLAAGYWARPRYTRDIDFTVMSLTGTFAPIVKMLEKEGFKVLKKGDSQIQVVQKGTLEFHVDMMLVEMDYQDWVVQRAKFHEMYQVKVPICSPEDLIILKLIAGRRQDLLDIEGVLEINIEKLDRVYLKKWFETWSLVAVFVKEFPEQAKALEII